jgi:hypothetical protein
VGGARRRTVAGAFDRGRVKQPRIVPAPVRFSINGGDWRRGRAWGELRRVLPTWRLPCICENSSVQLAPFLLRYVPPDFRVRDAIDGGDAGPIGFPSMWTAQAPHSAIPHPNFVPVIPAHRGSPTTAGCPHHIDGAIDSIDFDPESHGYLWGTISVNDLKTLRATLSPLEF